jgi:putative cardiolipin synthase
MKKLSKTILPALLTLTVSAPAFALLSPSRPLPPGAFASTEQTQNLIVLESGIASLEKRLQMIGAAKSTIDTEYYVYKGDKAGRLYTQALIEKAKKGVKVRILIDQGFANTNIDSHYAKILAENGIEVRFYNKTLLVNIKQSNHRTHRKSLIVDGIEAVVGGRNMADEYFDFSPTYNFIDRDVAVKGSIVKDITQSFENFWNSSLTKTAENVQEPKLNEYGLQSEREAQTQEGGAQTLAKFKKDHSDYITAMNNARNFIIPSKEDVSALSRIRKYAAELLQISPKGICQETYYYADTPGTSGNARVVQDQIQILVSTARKSVVVESPFFIQKPNENMFAQALARGVRVDILSNSLYSADVPLSVSPFLSTAKALTAEGANVFVHEGSAPLWLEYPNPQAKTARWGTHAKTLVIDEDTVLIGSFNMDPRSANLNAEMALVCRGNKELASAVSVDMERRKSIMVKLDRNGNPVDGRDKHLGASDSQKLKYRLMKPLSHIFDFWL